MRWAVVLAGGSGTRFWPLSTPDRPKHLLPLAGPESTLTGTLRALEPLLPREQVLLVTGAALADPIRESTGLAAESVLIEPRPASTGPALVWGAVEAARRDRDAMLLCLHADWFLPDAPAFGATALRMLEAAVRYDSLVTAGIVPDRPETGFGYIVAGAEVGGRVRRVTRFEEKPDPARARELIAQGARWNSGLFAWTARRLLNEVRSHCPEIAAALPALEAGEVERFFQEVTPISIDVGVLERSDRVITVPAAFPWDDVGTWSALGRIRATDAEGNVAVGPVHAVDSQGSVAWSDSLPIVLNGVTDLVVVCANGRILVMPKERAARLKEALDSLPPELRDPT